MSRHNCSRAGRSGPRRILAVFIADLARPSATPSSRPAGRRSGRSARSRRCPPVRAGCSRDRDSSTPRRSRLPQGRSVLRIPLGPRTRSADTSPRPGRRPDAPPAALPGRSVRPAFARVARSPRCSTGRCGARPGSAGHPPGRPPGWCAVAGIAGGRPSYSARSRRRIPPHGPGRRRAVRGCATTWPLTTSSTRRDSPPGVNSPSRRGP